MFFKFRQATHFETYENKKPSTGPLLVEGFIFKEFLG